MGLKQTLVGCSIFSGLSDAQLEKMAALAAQKQYEAGSTIFHEGDSAEELFVLQEGRVALQMTAPTGERQNGRRMTVDVIGTDDVIGWSAVVDPHKYTLTAVCLQTVNALSINGYKLRWLLKDDPQIGYQVLQELIKVVASRLDDTRRVLASERLLVP